MNQSSEDCIRRAAKVILADVNIDSLVEKLMLDGYLEPSELTLIKEKPTTQRKWMLLFDILDIDSFGFYILAKVLTELGFDELARCLNSITNAFLQVFVVDTQSETLRRNPVYTFDVCSGLDYTIRKFRAAGEKVPVVRIRQTCRKAFHITATQVAVFLNILKKLSELNVEGVITTASLGPEQTTVYNSSSRPFNPADTVHLAAVRGNYTNRLNLPLRNQNFDHPKLFDLDDGFHFCVDRRKIPKDDSLEQFAVYFSAGRVGHTVLSLAYAELRKLEIVMMESVKLLESLSENPTPAHRC